MKIALFALLIFGLFIGCVPCVYSWDDNTSNSPDKKVSPVVEGKTPVKKSTAAYDEVTTQSLKKFRSINSELVAAHQEIYRLENPDKTTKGLDMRDLFDEQNINREKKQQEQSAQNKKNAAEEKIKSLQNDAEKLKTDLEKHYKGTLPKNVEDAWQTEQNYTDYRISKFK
jgi:hypothetical protein